MHSCVCARFFDERFCCEMQWRQCAFIFNYCSLSHNHNTWHPSRHTEQTQHKQKCHTHTTFPSYHVKLELWISQRWMLFSSNTDSVQTVCVKFSLCISFRSTGNFDRKQFQTVFGIESKIFGTEDITSQRGINTIQWTYVPPFTLFSWILNGIRWSTVKNVRRVSNMHEYYLILKIKEIAITEIGNAWC